MVNLNLLHLAHQVYTYNEVCYTQAQVDTPPVAFLYHHSHTPFNRNQGCEESIEKNSASGIWYQQLWTFN